MTTKTSKVMEIFSIDDQRVVFVQESDEQPGRYTAAVVFMTDAWRDLNMPSTVTVTVEAGDTLNG